jgi:hypothetical protein
MNRAAQNSRPAQKIFSEVIRALAENLEARWLIKHERA